MSYDPGQPPLPIEAGPSYEDKVRMAAADNAKLEEVKKELDRNKGKFMKDIALKSGILQSLLYDRDEEFKVKFDAADKESRTEILREYASDEKVVNDYFDRAFDAYVVVEKERMRNIEKNIPRFDDDSSWCQC